ncbi:superoxide dismutase family protein [Stenotrophomonas sp. MMGLT7]|uniref:superoxide dismutase family protein n=1 Tax=Stenotrophomonas sp. MMGLT7 TaxID=2901227 RepID=UPI001E324A91|nr:superoxide dismutase family protein [Stenotrophomonas sp. MMGLT7]MCD7099903.1 superoxide dismutase family protein [Stenotrophomonas sp. MMGLT7]
MSLVRHSPLLRLSCAGCVLALLAACSSAPAPVAPTPPPPAPVVPPVQRAEAALAPASASLISGRMVLLPVADGVRITGTVGGLPPLRQFGFHVHERGDCSAVDASSAGAHFNPGATAHGRNGAGPHHAGDMDNLQSNADGVAQVDLRLPGVALGGGGPGDIVGRALVVHADPDDYRSQPAGNSGARVACGVIRPLAGN